MNHLWLIWYGVLLMTICQFFFLRVNFNHGIHVRYNFSRSFCVCFFNENIYFNQNHPCIHRSCIIIIMTSKSQTHLPYLEIYIHLYLYLVFSPHLNTFMAAFVVTVFYFSFLFESLSVFLSLSFLWMIIISKLEGKIKCYEMNGNWT